MSYLLLLLVAVEGKEVVHKFLLAFQAGVAWATQIMSENLK